MTTISVVVQLGPVPALRDIRQATHDLRTVKKTVLLDSIWYFGASATVHFAEFAWSYRQINGSNESHVLEGYLIPLHGIVLFVIGPRVIANLKREVSVRKAASTARVLAESGRMEERLPQQSQRGMDFPRSGRPPLPLPPPLPAPDRTPEPAPAADTSTYTSSRPSMHSVSLRWKNRPRTTSNTSSIRTARASFHTTRSSFQIHYPLPAAPSRHQQQRQEWTQTQTTSSRRNSSSIESSSRTATRLIPFSLNPEPIAREHPYGNQRESWNRFPVEEERMRLETSTQQAIRTVGEVLYPIR